MFTLWISFSKCLWFRKTIFIRFWIGSWIRNQLQIRELERNGPPKCSDISIWHWSDLKTSKECTQHQSIFSFKFLRFRKTFLDEIHVHLQPANKSATKAATHKTRAIEQLDHWWCDFMTSLPYSQQELNLSSSFFGSDKTFHD